MARLVIPARTGMALFRSETVEAEQPDGYKDRLVKYLPAESVAFYAFVDKLVGSHYGLNGSVVTAPVPMDATVISWVILLLGLVGTPIYLRQQRIGNQPWGLNAGISTIAFILWAYTLGGTVFLINGWYSAFVAGLLAPIFTFVAGFFAPAPK